MQGSRTKRPSPRQLPSEDAQIFWRTQNTTLASARSSFQSGQSSAYAGENKDLRMSGSRTRRRPPRQLPA